MLNNQGNQRQEYMGKVMVQKNEYEMDLIYSKMMKLTGFIQWESWVPMPYPHRELSIAR
jgi:hypothetical protein